MLILIVFAFLVVCKDLCLISALECWSCQGKCDCRGGVSQTCPSLYYSACYTIRSGDGHVTRRGCSSVDCSLDINPHNQNCNLCMGDLCNQEQGLVSMDSMDEDDCLPLIPPFNPGSAIPAVRNNYRANSARTTGLETHHNSNAAKNREVEPSNMVGPPRSDLGNPSAHYGPSPTMVGKTELNILPQPGYYPNKSWQSFEQQSTAGGDGLGSRKSVFMQPELLGRAVQYNNESPMIGGKIIFIYQGIALLLSSDANSFDSPVPAKKKKLDLVWQNFTQLNGLKKAKCNICQEEMTNTATVLRRHLDSRHRNITSLPTQTLSKASVTRMAQLDSAFGDVLAMPSLSLNVFTKPPMQKFLSLMNKQYTIPKSNSTLKKKLVQRYGSIEALMKKCIKDLTMRPSITLDLWTDESYKHAYLGVTLHFVKGSQLRRIFLGLSELKQDHSAENILSATEEPLGKFDLSLDGIFKIVTDNGSNAVAVFKDIQRIDINTEFECFECSCDKCAYRTNLLAGWSFD